MGLIFWLSSRSRLIEIESDAGEKLFFKSAHVIAYGLLAWNWWRALTAQRSINWPVLLLAFTLTVGYGISDEYHQLFVPGRHAKVADVIFDAAGALAMLLLLRRVSWLRNFPENLRLSSRGLASRQPQLGGDLPLADNPKFIATHQPPYSPDQTPRPHPDKSPDL
jgi:VanZ family protein